MKTQKTLSILVASLFIIGLVAAQGYNYKASEKFTTQEMNNMQNKFQNQYKFNCTGNCTYLETGENLMLQVNEQKQLNLFNQQINLEMREEYTLNEDGEIIDTKYNIWSRLLNKNRIRL